MLREVRLTWPNPGDEGLDLLVETIRQRCDWTRADVAVVQLPPPDAGADEIWLFVMP